MNRILACVDRSADALGVADLAAWASLRTGRRVRLLHVVGRKERGDFIDPTAVLGPDTHGPLSDRLDRLERESTGRAVASGRDLLAALARRIEATGAPAVEPLLRDGTLPAAIAALAADAGLIVVGRGGGRPDRRLSGTAARQLAARPGPPMIVAARSLGAIERLLLIVDDPAGAGPVLDHVAASGLFAGCELHLLWTGRSGPPPDVSAAAAAGRGSADRVRPPILRHIPGDPVGLVADYVRYERIDLVVTVATPSPAIGRLLTGGPAGRLMRACPVPVMVVRPNRARRA